MTRHFLILKNGSETIAEIRCDIRKAIRFIRTVSRFQKRKLTLAELKLRKQIAIVKIGVWFNGERITGKVNEGITG